MWRRRRRPFAIAPSATVSRFKKSIRNKRNGKTRRAEQRMDRCPTPAQWWRRSLSRNQSVDQGGIRHPGGFFDGEIQSPPGTAGSTVWRHASPGRTWSDCMATAQRIGIAADPGGLFPGRGLRRSPALDGLRWVQGDRMNSVGCTPSRWRAARYCVLIISFTSVGLEILTRSVSGLVSSSASTVMVP